MLPHEYATGTPYFTKAAEMKKKKKTNIFKSELYLQVSVSEEQLLSPAPGSASREERRAGRAAAGPAPAPQRKPGLGGGPSRHGRAGRCGPSPSEQEMKGLLRGTQRRDLLLLLGGGF